MQVDRLKYSTDGAPDLHSTGGTSFFSTESGMLLLVIVEGEAEVNGVPVGAGSLVSAERGEEVVLIPLTAEVRTRSYVIWEDDPFSQRRPEEALDEMQHDPVRAAQDRVAIVEATLWAMDRADEVGALIESSADRAEALQRLIGHGPGFGEVEANHILDMMFGRRTRLARTSLAEERDALMAVLASEA